MMATCKDCETVLDFDEERVDEGEIIVCDECGSEYEVVGTDPLELVKIDEDAYEDEEAIAVDEEEE